MMSQYIHTVILPEMIWKEIESNNQPLEINQLLKQYNFTCICLSTVYKWLKRLGFSYEPRKKRYYVDGHVREATINYQWHFIKRYLTYEYRMFCWIQISLQEALELEKEGKIPKQTGYHYCHPETDKAMIEYHVDTREMFQEQMNKEIPYRG
jgi:hypothetical protein